jgi:pSer/pThr/pTyr-binding forkhead associated (FHA) protein
MKPNVYDISTIIPAERPEIHVVLEEGLSDPKEWSFTDSFLIGRQQSDDVHIQNDRVSRTHALVYPSKGKWWVQDMNSLNGTLIKGERISRCQLGPKTNLQLGGGGPVLKLHVVINIHPSKLNERDDETLKISNSKLRVIVNEGETAQKEWVFTRPFIMGRNRNTDICFNDSTVSRFHALVRFREGKWWIEDMNSANGIIINDHKTSTLFLEPNTKLRLGKFGPILILRVENLNSHSGPSNFFEFKQNGDQRERVSKRIDNKVAPSSDISAQEGFSSRTSVPLKKSGHSSSFLSKWCEPGQRRSRLFLACLMSIIFAVLALAGYSYWYERPKSLMDEASEQLTKMPKKKENSRSKERETIPAKMTIGGEENTHKVPEKKVLQPRVVPRKMGSRMINSTRTISRRFTMMRQISYANIVIGMLLRNTTKRLFNSNRNFPMCIER